MDEGEFLGMLIEEGAGGGADKAPWWPEFLRLRGEHSLRALAERFGTEPRRLRRGLARAGLRVSGRDLADGDGSPKLAAYRDVLGKERDAAIAKAAGVIPEAVQGERRRLGVEAYRQRPRVRFTRDDEEWIRGPKKLRRERFRPEDASLHVVRRPTRTVEAPAPREAAPVTEVSRFPSPRAVELPPRRPSVSPSDFFAESRRRDFHRGEREEELDRLLQPTRIPRDGRMRLIRAEPSRPAGLETPAEPAPLGVIRRRVVAPEAPRPVEAPVEAAPPARPATTVRSRPMEPSAPVVRRVVAPSPPPAPAAPSRPSVRASAAAAPELAPVVEVAPASQVTPMTEWLVYVPGRETPLRVEAEDIASAALKAAGMVPARLLARASIWRADQAAPEPDLL